VQPPVVVAPQPSTPKVDEASQNRLLLTYGQSISKEIKRYQKYPPTAQRRGWEGTAEVLLQIAADGKVTGITLGKSSGHSMLDDEALDMVRRASPLPQAPPDLRGRALVVTVPIVFKLQNS
jgi:protein TonB